MTDQELDTLMRRVLLDSLKLDAESTASGELAFEPTPRYQRQMAAMVKAAMLVACALVTRPNTFSV